jgi:hypothetical protein
MTRPVRSTPAELSPDWPHAASDDALGEVARRFAAQLRVIMGEKSARAVAKETGVSHLTILDVLAGRTWPDMFTIAKLEAGLAADLWPGRIAE